MTDQSNPRSQPVRMGEREQPSLEDDIRAAARTNAKPTSPATEAAQKAGLSSGSTADDYMHDYTDTDPPLPLESGPVVIDHQPAQTEFQRIEKLFGKSLDSVRDSLYADIDELQKQLAHLRIVVQDGTGKAKEHMSGFFGMGHSTQDIIGAFRERIENLQGIVEKL